MNSTTCAPPKANLQEAVKAKPRGLFRGSARRRKSWNGGMVPVYEGDFKPHLVNGQNKMLVSIGGQAGR